MQDTARVRAFVKNMSDSDKSAVARARHWDVAPGWWDSNCDIGLLQAISEFGLLLAFAFIADPERPFAVHIPDHLADEFRRLAEVERSKGRAQRPKDPGEFGFLLNEKSRMGRAISVIQLAQARAGRRCREDNGESKSPAPKGPSTELPALPLELASHLIVRNFGRFTPASSHYPVGYLCHRQYFSVDNPAERCWYEATTEISPAGTLQFRVRSLENSAKEYVCHTSSGCWELLIQEVQAKRRSMGLPTRKCTSVSGPVMYGFSFPQIIAVFRLMN
jgi:hypothetical protein